MSLLRTIPSLMAMMISIICSGSNKVENEITDKIIIELSQDTVYVSTGNLLSVSITVNKINLLEKLVIKKSTLISSSVYKAILPAEFEKNSYQFNYEMTDDDKESFRFIIEAYNLSGEISNLKGLQVNDNQSEIKLIDLVKMARITGKSLAGEKLPNPNRTDELYDLGGADLGIVWEMDEGHVGIFFGDTYGKDFVANTGGPNGSNWRSNVLAFSSDTNMNDGLNFTTMALDNNGNARQIASSAHNTSGSGDWTSIPTAAIRANGVDYLHYMNVRNWRGPKGWETNYSSLYSSKDNGKTWDRCSEVNFGSQSIFAQICYAKADGYVYMIGTQSGRQGNAYLARFLEKDILDMTQYEYWNSKDGWIKNNESAASAIFEATVGESSLMYQKKYKRWIATYFDADKYALMYRDAPEINGPWSQEKLLASGSTYPQLYGSYMHPLFDDEDTIYFLMSEWQAYNVFLMRASIKN